MNFSLLLVILPYLAHCVKYSDNGSREENDWEDEYPDEGEETIKACGEQFVTYIKQLCKLYRGGEPCINEKYLGRVRHRQFDQHGSWQSRVLNTTLAHRVCREGLPTTVIESKICCDVYEVFNANERLPYHHIFAKFPKNVHTIIEKAPVYFPIQIQRLLLSTSIKHLENWKSEKNAAVLYYFRILRNFTHEIQNCLDCEKHHCCRHRCLHDEGHPYIRYKASDTQIDR